MAVSGEEKIVEEGGASKKKYIVTFDNGTLDQIEELKTFFKQGDKLDVVKLAISLLQSAKEAREKSK
jgi:hypothetical protein